MPTKRFSYAYYPFILFWLGLLTGVLLIAVILLYEAIQGEELQTKVMRNVTPTKTQTVQQLPLKNAPSPYYGEPGGWKPKN